VRCPKILTFHSPWCSCASRVNTSLPDDNNEVFELSCRCSYPTLGTACSKSKYSSRSFQHPPVAILTPGEANLGGLCHCPSDLPRTARSAQWAWPRSLPPLRHIRPPHTACHGQIASSAGGSSCPRSWRVRLLGPGSLPGLGRCCRAVLSSPEPQRSSSPCFLGLLGRCPPTRRSAPCSTRRHDIERAAGAPCGSEGRGPGMLRLVPRCIVLLDPRRSCRVHPGGRRIVSGGSWCW
jgi:hypothetical protein